MQWCRSKRHWRYAIPLFISCLIAGNLCLTILFSTVSSCNYPGGDAFHQLHIINQNKRKFIINYLKSFSLCLFVFCLKFKKIYFFFR